MHKIDRTLTRVGPIGRVLRQSLLLVLAVCLLLWPARASGYVTTRDTYAPVNYFIFLPPDLGGSYIDPSFGTTIKRLSDARRQPNAADVGNLIRITHEYSTVSPFNRDNSLILVGHQSYFALYDGSGSYLRDLPFEIREPRWSRHDPNLFYYLSRNQLKLYNTATQVISLVHSFDEYTAVSGMGESDISVDGDHLVLVGDNRQIFVIQISTRTKGAVLDTAGLGGFDHVQITPNNNVLVGWYARSIGPYRGVELYDRNMNFLRQVSHAIGHMDVTQEASGEEVLVHATDPGPICTTTLVKIRLADGYQTCLMSFHPSLAVHVSAPDAAGWVIISTYAGGDPHPLEGWTPYANEILQIKLDGSEVRRLAHHRSRPFNTYTWTPRAAVSRDGSRMLYSSNYGLQSVLRYPSEYSDVYLTDLSSIAPSTAGSENPVVAVRFEQDHPAVTYSGTWLTLPHSLHSNGSAMLSMEPGARVTFTFSGTAVSWIGYRDEWSGIASVYVDGELKAPVDTFATPGQSQAVLFSINGLSLGSHTLVVEVSGGRNPASSGSWVWFDGADVATRFEQDHPAVMSSGTWLSHPHSLHSDGSALLSMEPGARVTFTFSGTAVSWIGYRDEWAGIARVYIDGNLRAEIDTYATPGRAQALIYTISGLAPGTHTLILEATQRENPAAAGAWVWVDGFETLP